MLEVLLEHPTVEPGGDLVRALVVMLLVCPVERLPGFWRRRWLPHGRSAPFAFPRPPGRLRLAGLRRFDDVGRLLIDVFAALLGFYLADDVRGAGGDVARAPRATVEPRTQLDSDGLSKGRNSTAASSGIVEARPAAWRGGIARGFQFIVAWLRIGARLLNQRRRRRCGLFGGVFQSLGLLEDSDERHGAPPSVRRVAEPFDQSWAPFAWRKWRGLADGVGRAVSRQTRC